MYKSHNSIFRGYGLSKFVLSVSTSFLLASVFHGEIARAQPSFSNVPAPLQVQLQQDIDFVKDIKGTNGSSLYQGIFGETSMSGKGLSDFFEKRITEFGMDSCGGGPGVAACVQPFLSTHTMWITPMYATSNIPQIYRVSVIFHEARHTEVNKMFWHHANCPIPYLDANGHDIVGIISGTKMEGKNACDSVKRGAYGLQAVLLKNIAKACTNCGQKMMMDAELFGDDTLNRISDLKLRDEMIQDLN